MNTFALHVFVRDPTRDVFRMRLKAKLGAGARDQIRNAAERCFAGGGFCGTSINDIAAATKFTKPTIYYHFGSKLGLFNEILACAHDECFARMQAAAQKSQRIEAQLEEILGSLFEFFQDRQDLTRLAFAAAFSAPKDSPRETHAACRKTRNFEFFHELVRRGQREGVLDASFDSRTLAYGIYGALSFHLMANVILPGTKLDRRTAKEVVRLFFQGAAAKPTRRNSPR